MPNLVATSKNAIFGEIDATRDNQFKPQTFDKHAKYSKYQPQTSDSGQNLKYFAPQNGPKWVGLGHAYPNAPFFSYYAQSA